MRYFIKTFGCQMNVSDSERIAGFLETHKLKPAKDIQRADLVVFNTCGVRQSAENRAYGQIHNLSEINEQRTKNKKIKIILTGCLADRKDVQKRLEGKVDIFCQIKEFFKEVETLVCHPERSEGSRDSSTPQSCAQNDIFYLNISPKYGDSKNTFVPIMSGCNNFCSYCVVPYARGREISRPAEDIVDEIDKLAKNGCEEITLLGQNVNSYEYELKNLKIGNWKLIENWKLEIGNSATINFPKLLELLAKSYPIMQFKFLTSHPKDFSEELIDVIAKNKNISHEIHLPLQSGSDKILKAMNRPYAQKYYLNLIQKIRKKIPSVTFTTDAIVGFPHETQKDFKETVKVFKEVKYNEAYINKYSPRPGTAAWKLEDPIKWEEKKRREKTLRKILAATR